jgi:hypothetical protein
MSAAPFVVLIVVVVVVVVVIVILTAAPTPGDRHGRRRRPIAPWGRAPEPSRQGRR